MIVRIILLTLLVQTQTIWAQKAMKELFVHVENVRREEDMKAFSHEGFHISKDYHDFLEYGIQQSTWVLKKRNKNTGIRLLTLSLNGDIFYQEFYEMKKHGPVVLHRKNQLSAMPMLDKLISENDFDLIGYRRGRSIFGVQCFYSAEPPPEGLIMVSYVRNNDIASLKGWLKCINPVKKIYAYFGLILLERNSGLIPDEETREQMALIREFPIPVYTCSGCVDFEFKLVREILEESEFVLRVLNHWVHMDEKLVK